MPNLIQKMKRTISAIIDGVFKKNRKRKVRNMDRNVDPKRMKAINGNVLVVDNAKEEISTGGIVLPGTAEADKVICGRVMSLSPFLLEDGRLMDPPIVVNASVIYSTHAGAGNIWIDPNEQRTYRLLKWNEILAVVND